MSDRPNIICYVHYGRDAKPRMVEFTSDPSNDERIARLENRHGGKRLDPTSRIVILPSVMEKNHAA